MKEIISMSKRELDQVSILSKLKAGLITQKQAAEAIRMSVRQVQRKIKSYIKEGAKGIIHKSRGRPSNRRTPKERELAVISAIKERYTDFGPTLAAEILAENEGLVINPETLRLLMIRNGIWVKHKRKSTYRRSRKRKSCVGQMIQLDGSLHDWFEGRREKCTLLVYIDDASSRVMWLEFVESESLLGVMKATKHYVEKYGRPVRFYTDFGKVFSVNLNNPERDKKTQFERALEELNIGIIHAHSPQAKGRVERSNKTHQDRLIKMLRLENISTIEEANAYLQTVYMSKHNIKFAVDPASEVDLHRSLEGYNLDNILCLKDKRNIMNDYTIRYENGLYQIEPEQKAVVRPNEKVTIYKSLEGKIRLFTRGIQLNFHEISVRPVKLKEVKPVKPRTWKPATNHPWRGRYKKEPIQNLDMQR